MIDFATLVLAADTRQMTQAEKAIDGVTKSGERAEKQTDKTSRAIDNMNKMARRAAIGAGALITATVALTRSSMNQIDALTKQARQVGLLTRDFQAMSLVAEEAGVSTGSLTNMLGIMQRNIVELSRGTANQTRAFQQLGISLKDLQGLSPDQQFERIAAALSAVEDPAQKTALAMEVFGRSGREAINMLNGYTDALDDARRFQEAFGIAVGQDAAEAIERANDAVGRLSMGFRGLGNLLAAEAAPRVEAFANRMIDLIVQTDAINRVANVMTAVLERAVFVLGAAAAAFGVYRAAAVVASVATMGFATALGVARAALIRLGIGALIVGAGELAFQLTRLVERTGGWGNALELLGDVASGVWEGIKTSARSIEPALGAVWQDIRAGFFSLMEALTRRWTDFLLTLSGGVSNIPGAEEIAASIVGAAARSDAAMAGFTRSANQAAASADNLRGVASQMASSGFDNARAALAKLNKTVDENTTETDGAADAADRLNAALEKVTETTGGAGGGGGGVVPEIKKLNEELQQTPQFVNDLASAWGDFVVNGFRDFQGFVRNVLNSFKRMISSMVADAARARIMQALGAGGGMAAGPAMASGGGGMGGAGGLLGSLLPAAGTATGFAGGLGNAMGGSIFNVANNAMAAGGGLMATMGAALPIAGLVLGGIMAIGQAQTARFQRRMAAQLREVEELAARKEQELAVRLQANADATDALIQSMQLLAQLEQEREQAARAILAEREGLEIELLRLQNDLVALREREIAALEPVNRQLGRFIMAMRDAAQAIEQQRRALETMGNIGRGIVEFVMGIRGQDQRRFAQDLALAQGGDISASQRITTSAGAAIGQARETAATGVDFDRFVGQTAAALLALPAVATFEEQQIALLEEISDGVNNLTQLQDNTQRRLIDAIRSGFFVIDKNLDGKLTFEELKAGLGGIATDAELRNIFNLLDLNNDGVINNLERIVGSQMDSAEIITRRLISGFGQLDTNLDNKLTFDELQQGLGHIATDAELRNIFNQLDKNGDGVIDQFEKLMGVENINSQSLANVIARGFDALDTNLDGKLTFEELQKGLGHIATDAELKALFGLLDRNGDGTIDRLEALGGSNENIDENTFESWLASQDQISNLKIIAGETANNTQRVAALTDAIQNLVFGQKTAAAQQLTSLQQQRAAAQQALQSAQAALSKTPATIRGPRRFGIVGPRASSPNPAFVGLEADIRRLATELAQLDAQIRNVPQFATGGMHMGGARIVGERGPELEVTGSSRIYNNGDTMSMLSNAPVVSELKQLRREIASFRDEQRQLGIQTSRNTERTTRVLREWDVTGLPEVRTL
jgi:Ca2+-binding EF-hand superfamily protein